MELKNLKNYNPIQILGNMNKGKSSLAVWLAKQTGFEKLYVLGYPDYIEGFINLSDIKDLSKIQDCCVVIDEIDEIIPIYDKKSNDSLRRVLKFAFHNRIKLIMNTQLSQFVTRMMEALIPCWAITELDIFSLKQGSKPKRILLNHIKAPEVVNKEIGMRLETGKFIWYNEYAEAGENGIYAFPDQNLGKVWTNTKKDRQALIKSIQDAK